MINFDEESHTYWVNGIVTPCVSDILHFIFPDKYKGVDKTILNNKAKYGSIVHKAIECLEQGLKLPKLDYIQEASLDQYKKLVELKKIEVISQEQKIQYKGMYAGTYDMEANVNGIHSLIDIKTTAELDIEYLSWQLSLYELAIGKKFKKLYCLWLPKRGLGKLVEINRKPKKELLRVLEEFYNEPNEPQRYE